MWILKRYKESEFLIMKFLKGRWKVYECHLWTIFITINKSVVKINKNVGTPADNE